jgi:hypothetical protein
VYPRGELRSELEALTIIIMKQKEQVCTSEVQRECMYVNEARIQRIQALFIPSMTRK